MAYIIGTAYASTGYQIEFRMVLQYLLIQRYRWSLRELQLTKSLTTLGKPGRQVAVITRRPHGYFITHVEGASFPLVNGRAIDAQARLLHDHDIIELAGVKMEFFLQR